MARDRLSKTQRSSSYTERFHFQTERWKRVGNTRDARMSKFQPGQNRRMLPELRIALGSALASLSTAGFQWYKRVRFTFHVGALERTFHFLLLTSSNVARKLEVPLPLKLLFHTRLFCLCIF